MRLQDKVAIITGGASGMGRVASRLFAGEGARVVVADVTAEAAEAAAQDVINAGGQATAVAADVSTEDGAKRMVDHAVATFGRVDVLYNNAGIMPEADHSVIDTDVALVGCSVPQDAYTASKGAVLSLTRSLAVQFGPHGVRSNAICPGPVETPLLMDWLLKDEAAKQLRLARNPTG